jgi:hypothetical protein
MWDTEAPPSKNAMARISKFGVRACFAIQSGPAVGIEPLREIDTT